MKKLLTYAFIIKKLILYTEITFLKTFQSNLLSSFVHVFYVGNVQTFFDRNVLLITQVLLETKLNSCTLKENLKRLLETVFEPNKASTLLKVIKLQRVLH